MRESKRSSARIKKHISNITVQVILTVLALIWLIPIFWVILQSFRKEKGAYISTFLPKNYTIDNYVRLFKETGTLNFPQMFWNTFLIAVATCIVSTLFVLSVAFCMSRIRFKLRKPFMNIAMILGLFPGFMSMIAVYYILKALNLSEGAMIRVALVIVYSAGSGLTFQIAKGFFDTIPKALDEAAILDGCTRFQVFTNVTVPLSKPIIVYTIITTFLVPWLDFVFAKVICRADAKYYTVSIGLWKMLEKENVYEWFTRFACGAVLVSIPISILFIVVQRFYVDGLSGAVKG